MKGHALTIHDLVFPSQITDSDKKEISLSLCGDISSTTWFQTMKKIAQGIEYLNHKGIIHRHLKTDNIALYEQDVELMPVILDFGKSDFLRTQIIINTT